MILDILQFFDLINSKIVIFFQPLVSLLVHFVIDLLTKMNGLTATSHLNGQLVLLHTLIRIYFTLPEVENGRERDQLEGMKVNTLGEAVAPIGQELNRIEWVAIQIGKEGVEEVATYRGKELAEEGWITIRNCPQEEVEVEIGLDRGLTGVIEVGKEAEIVPSKMEKTDLTGVEAESDLQKTSMEGSIEVIAGNEVLVKKGINPTVVTAKTML